MSVAQHEVLPKIVDASTLPVGSVIRAQVLSGRAIPVRDAVVDLHRMAGRGGQEWVDPTQESDWTGWYFEDEIVAVVEVLYSPAPVVPAQRVGGAE